MDQYYGTLGLKPGASLKEVEEAYKDLANVWHPDRFAHDPRLQKKAQEKMKEINEAYQKLGSLLNSTQAQEKPAPEPVAAAPTPPSTPPKTDENFKSDDFRLWAWVSIAIVIGFAVYQHSKMGHEPQRIAAAPVEQFRVAIDNEKLKMQAASSNDEKALTPEEVLARKKKEAERWGASPDSKTAAIPKPAASATRSHFTVGSTKEEVIAAQGAPDSASSNLFSYGESRVYFDDGKVTSWDNHTPRLKARLRPSRSTGNTTFTVGSTKDEVLSAQGTPDSFSDDQFTYGNAVIHFANNRVTSWYDKDSQLKVKMLPE